MVAGPWTMAAAAGLEEPSTPVDSAPGLLIYDHGLGRGTRECHTCNAAGMTHRLES